MVNLNNLLFLFDTTENNLTSKKQITQLIKCYEA